MSKEEFEKVMQEDIESLVDLKKSFILYQKSLIEINYNRVIEYLGEIIIDLIYLRDMKPSFMKHEKVESDETIDELEEL